MVAASASAAYPPLVRNSVSWRSYCFRAFSRVAPWPFAMRCSFFWLVERGGHYIVVWSPPWRSGPRAPLYRDVTPLVLPWRTRETIAAERFFDRLAADPEVRAAMREHFARKDKVAAPNGP